MPQPTHSRRWPRYNFDLPVRVLLGRGTREVVIPGRGTALNEGGLAVDVGTKLRVGKCLFVEFRPPYCPIPCRVPATVRNVRSSPNVPGSRYGVEFVPSDALGRQEIETFREILRRAARDLQ